jgi:TatD DNase family protein
MIDSHCHLDFKEFNGRRAEIIQAALDTGVHTLINIGTDPETSRNSVALADKHDCIYATVGIHPHDAQKYNHKVAEELQQLIAHDKVVAVGEIGLDFYRDLSPRKVQRKVFRWQLEMAVEKKLPVVVHTRESFREAVDIVREYASDLPGGVFHCFPGTIAEAEAVIAIGFHIGIGGVVTYPGAKMAEVAARVPLSSILLETDCPYLAPVPYRGKINQPAYIRYIRDKIAELRGITPDEVEKITDRNCRKMYRLVETFEG